MNIKERKQINKLFKTTKEMEQAGELKDKTLRRIAQKKKNIRYNLRGVI